MKIRILPLLGFLFATAIVSRAFALSSDGLGGAAQPYQNNATKTTNQNATQLTNQDSAKTPEQKQTKTTAEAQCVTGEVLIAINEKMSLLSARETEMQKKQSAFKAIEARMNKQLAAINAAKASLDASVEARTDLAQADIEHLTLMYQTMKPKQAAKIFNEMDVNFAAGFLRKMKGSQAGLILSNMNAKKAYQISLIIASKGAKYRQSDSSYP